MPDIRDDKYTVKEVLNSITWSIDDGKLVLLSTLTSEYVTIDLNAIQNGKTK